jgi:peptidoglycan/xylan/chitin deacetylase (PgdA/CDA1 family)
MKNCMIYLFNDTTNKFTEVYSMFNISSLKRFFINISLCLISAIFFLTGCTAVPSTSNITNTTSASTTTNTSSSTSTATPKPTKKVALTFDDGPHKTYTVSIADELAKYGFHATFFVVGNRVDGKVYNGGSAAAYVLEKGNEIGIHGYTHTLYYNKCTDEEYSSEINGTLEAIKKISAEYDAKLMRPIGGSITSTRVSSSPYSVILWNVDSEDWKHKYRSGDTASQRDAKVDIIVNNVMSTVSDGSIILMHDIYESTYDAVKILLPLLQARGYEVVTVSELLGKPQPGTKYNKR